MRWYSLLFSIISRSVIPYSSNHCNCQRIIIMYSYICIMFYFCVRQIFFCHTKQVASAPSHHQTAEWSSVVSPPLILPIKSIVLPPSISLPTHADSLSHVTSQTVNQPREEAPCFRRWSVHPRPLEVALCCRHQSYRKNHRVAAVDQSTCARWFAVARKQPNYQPAERRSTVSLPSIIPPATGRSSIVSLPLIIPRKKHCFAAVDQSALARRLAIARN